MNNDYLLNRVDKTVDELNDALILASFTPLIKEAFEAQMRKMQNWVDRYLSFLQIPWLDITVGSYTNGWRMVRWSKFRQSWFLIVASETNTKRPLGVHY